MAKLILAKDNVFPVVNNAAGDPLEEKPMTGFSFAGTIQGEGKLAGTTALFVRLAGCNLRCIWKMMDGGNSRCDTPYASFNTDETVEMEVNDVFELVKANLGPIQYVVMSGGEPLLQHEALAQLCRRIKLELEVHITLETNGTRFSSEVARWVDLYSISPKLSNSEPNKEKLASYQITPHEGFFYDAERRLNLKALQSYIDLHNQQKKDLQFKFVVGQSTDEDEIKQVYLEQLKNWRQDDIMLMPLGATVEEEKQTQDMVLQMAIKNGWRFSPRLHLSLFKAKVGV